MLTMDSPKVAAGAAENHDTIEAFHDASLHHAAERGQAATDKCVSSEMGAPVMPPSADWKSADMDNPWCAMIRQLRGGFG